MTTTLAAELSAALAERYVLERELGGGGMSRVFLARELALGRTVVLKVLPEDTASGVSAERFAREIQLAASLSQANIVPVLATGDARGIPFYTMPFVAGESLRHRMASGPVPAAEAVGILRDIARALGYAHERGVVHRDIKPENVLLSHGAAVVTDFGIAKAIAAAREGSRETARGGTLTQAGSSIGTPAYMAPEQAVGDVVDARADLYAWGVVAYELLAGRHPFADRATAPALIAAHVADTPAPLLDLLAGDVRRDPRVRAAAEAAMRCLAKSPSDRPESAAALLGALDARTSASSVRPRMAVLTGAALAIALVIGGAALWMRRSPDSANTKAGLKPNRVVVATFDNRTGDATLTPVGLMAADWIARGLATAEVVEVAGTAADLASRGIATPDSGTAARAALARNANAGLVIAGTYYRQGDSLLLQADILDANAGGGRLLQTVGPVGALASAPLAGVETLRQRVVGGLAVLVDSSLGPYASRSLTMPSYEAYREFLQGEELYYRDQAAAREHYTRAAGVDSSYSWPVLRLINNAYDQGDGERMDSLIAVLRARRVRLSPYEAAYLDLLSCDRVIEQCVEATSAMRRAAPRSQFAEYMTALVLRQLNRPIAAESVFRTLDRRGGELRGRTILYLHYASTELQLGHDSSALALAREGNGVAGSPVLFLYFEMAALARMRRFDEMMRTFDTVWALPAERRAGAARRAAQVLYVLRHQGDSAQAEALGARVFAALAARAAPEAGSVPGRTERAAVLMATRRWADLEALTDSMMRGGDDRVLTLEARGVALAALGRREEAMAVASRLEHPTRPVRPQDGCSLAWRVCRTASRAMILAMLGRRAEAAALLEDRMYRIFLNWYAEWGLLGEQLRGEPAFEAYVRGRG